MSQRNVVENVPNMAIIMENWCFILRPPPKYTRHFPPKEKLMEIESQRKTCKTKKKITIETCYTLGVCPGKTNIFPLNHILKLKCLQYVKRKCIKYM